MPDLSSLGVGSLDLDSSIDVAKSEVEMLFLFAPFSFYATVRTVPDTHTRPIEHAGSEDPGAGRRCVRIGRLGYRGSIDTKLPVIDIYIGS